MNQTNDPNRKELLKAAYRKIESLRTRLAAVEALHSEPVAIVGMSCRFPGGVEDPESFWTLLSNGLDGTTEIPPDRWNVDDYYDPDPDAPNKMYVRRGGFINNVRGFDPLFFHVSPLEAASMDPQQRVLLEVAWEALENAGQAPDRMAGSKTGVFVGMSGGDFAVMAVRAMHENAARTHMATGLSPSISAGHLSYFFGLRGPCISLDTACSSALTAIHLACDSLRRGEATAALAGSVNLILSPDGNVIVCKARMLAPDGHCKTFDALADGYSRSEGCAVLVLKLLSQAQADGNRILAVIRGSACNQDGRTNGITAPNGIAQREVIEAALAAAQVSPEEIDYVETHGTGTSLGDPIEVQALGEVFTPGRSPDSKVTLGAVKSNIGHIEAAAGMAAICKVTLAMQKGAIPPNLHLQAPNPHIPWDALPFRMPTSLAPWPSKGQKPRLAGVSAFGFSGTNVHMILEQAPVIQDRATVPDRGRHLLTLSAQTPKALTDLAERYLKFLEQTPDANLGDVCFTANVGRAHFAHRMAVSGDTVDEIKRGLTDFNTAPADSSGPMIGQAPSRTPTLGLVINRIAPASGRRLYASSAFQKAFDACEAEVHPFRIDRLSDILMSSVPDQGLGDVAPARQNALALALAHATMAQWCDWGLAPAAVTGSGPEICAAAVAAGAITLEDAFVLILGIESARASAVRWSTPQIPVLSPVTGLPLTSAASLASLVTTAPAPSQAPGYPSPVIDGMDREGIRLVLSLGESSLAPNAPSGTGPKLLSVPHGSWREILEAAGRLFVAGVAFDWTRFETPWPRRRLALPTYPFQRQDCWLEIAPPRLSPRSSSAKAVHPLLGRRLHAVSFQDTVVFEATFGADSPALLKDHQYYKTAVVSLTTMLEAALAGGRACMRANPLLEDVAVEQPLLLPAGQSRIVQTVFTPSPSGGFTFSICSADPASLEENPLWHRHCTGRTRPMETTATRAVLDGIMTKYSHAADPEWFYDTVAKSGVDYGPSFKLMRFILRGEDGAFAKVALPRELERYASDYLVHPGLLDAAIQALGLSFRFDGTAKGQQNVYMPVGLERLSLFAHGVAEIWCHATIREGRADHRETFVGDVQLFTPAGALVGELTGVHFKRNAGRRLVRDIDERRLGAWLYKTQWDALPSPSIEAPLGQHWLIIAEEPVLAAALADRIRAHGGQSILAFAGDAFSRESSRRYRLQLTSAGDYDQLMRAVLAGGPLDRVAYVTETEGQSDVTVTDVPGAVRRQTLEVLELVQALTRHGISSLATLALVTRGFQTPSLAEAASLAAGAIWGLGRVVATELPDLNCRLLDIDAKLTAEEAADRLAAEIALISPENQVALDRSGRFGLRLAQHYVVTPPHELATVDAALGAVQLAIGTRGGFDQLRFVNQEAAPPGPKEVQLRILATAMNFRDVLNVLGMYPGDPGSPGVECVGEIVAIGAEIEGVALGDQVLAMPERGYCTFANAPMTMVFRRPENLSLGEAATVLVAYLTATYALNHIGKMTAGERVLIHAGAGGVGLAAVQLAQRAGAEVFATAGSPAKRDYLRRLGVPHVFDSRSTDFVAEIKRITAGGGVDLVLNSLTGRAMAESLALLRHGGRFLEIGKTDVFTADEAQALNPLARHVVIDLLAPFQNAAALMQALFDGIRQGLSTGELRPLPHRDFALDETPQAFRYMAAAKHIGKVVVVDRSWPGYTPFEPSGSYLITGGLGGLGLISALSLAREGARHIILVGRRPPRAEAQAVIKTIEDLGATVHVRCADVGDRQQLAELLAETVSPARPLRGIIHAAGVIEDGTLSFENQERFERVMRPKIDGAWHLHELTLKSPLDFFILFSSGAGLFGNPGQSSYAAASVFLDELARARQNAGLPALSIDWGPWAEVGMAARMDKRHAQDWDTRGLRSIQPDEGATILQMVLRSSRDDQVAVLPVEPGSWGRSSAQSGSPLLAGLVQAPAGTAARSSTGDAVRLFREAEPSRKHHVLVEVITTMVVEMFGLDASRALSPDQNLTEIGMDSLLAIQLSNRLKTSFSVALPATLAFHRPTVRDIADYVIERAESGSDSGSAGPSLDATRDPGAATDEVNAANAETLLANLDQLSDGDVEKMLQALERGNAPV